jgi:6,7-dimethyl-8-ribityllumazine synthase
MIKSIHHLITARNEQEYTALRDFFSVLGLSLDQSWEGERSRGSKFHAPEGGVEVGYGRGFPQAELVIEVSDADAIHEIALRKKITILQKIADTEWDSRMFTLQAPAGMQVAIFSYNHPPQERNELQNELRGNGRRFAIVVSRFNSFITERLLTGALQGLRQTGARNEDISVVRVPGSFEIPTAARELASTKKYDAIICLGCLLRGDTAHYDVIANETTRGIGQSAQETGVPHAFGVLTCDTLEQAIDRAGLKSGNKGFDAALAAVEMAGLKEAVSNQHSAVSPRTSKSSKKISRSPRNDNRGKVRKLRAKS